MLSTSFSKTKNIISKAFLAFVLVFFVSTLFTQKVEAAPARCQTKDGATTIPCPTEETYRDDTCWIRAIRPGTNESTPENEKYNYSLVLCSIFESNQEAAKLAEEEGLKKGMCVMWSGIVPTFYPCLKEVEKTSTPKDNLPTCGIVWGQSGTPVGCLAQIIYYVIYIPIAWIAGLFGMIFDFFMGYSLSDEAYRYDFVVTGWKLVRDIANIIFIIIMIWTGVAAIFDLKGGAGSTMRRVIPALIINALIINFSLFATRVVIDISNITARIFYSRMIVCKGKCDYKNGSSVPTNIKRGIAGYWPISEKIISGFDPQKMFRPEVINPPTTKTDDKKSDPFQTTQAGQLIEQKGGTINQDSASYAGYYALVSLLAAGIMIMIAIMFWKTGFFFIGRVIGLYVAMIFSPFAFLTLNGGGGFFKIKEFEWANWVKDLSTYAMLAPIFMFFLYIINVFFESNLVTQLGIKSVSGSFFETLIEILIPMIFIFMLIKVAQEKATDYAGKMGKMVQGFAEKTIGTVGTITAGGVGIAAGGAALLGTRVGAPAVNALAKSTGLTNWAARNRATNSFARWTNNAINKTQTGTWDVRNSALGGFVGNQLTKGANFVDRQMGGTGSFRDTITSKDFLGKDAQKGGAVGLAKARKEEEQKLWNERFSDEKLSHLSKDEIQALWAQMKKGKEKDIVSKGDTQDREQDFIINAIKEKLSKEDAAIKKSFEDAEQHSLDAGTKQRLLDAENARLTSDKAEDADKDAIGKRIADLQKSLSMTIENLSNVQKVNNEAIAKAQADKKTVDEITNTAEYKQIRIDAEEKAAKTVAGEYDDFGEVKDAKTLSNIMKYDHVKSIQESSQWMKDGKVRDFGTFATILGGVGLTAGGAAGGILGEAVGQMIRNSLEEEARGVSEAAKEMLDKIKKSNKKTGRQQRFKEDLTKDVERYEEQLNTIQAEIKDVLQKGLVGGEDIETLSEERRERIIKDAKIDAESDFELAKSNYEKLKRASSTPGSTVSKDEMKNALRDRAEKEDKYEAVKSLTERHRRANENLKKATASAVKEAEKNDRADEAKKVVQNK